MASTASKPRAAKLAAKSDTGRIFFLELSGGRVLSAKSDGSDLKTIVSEGRKLPDGIVVDISAGHLYWTNMGNPSANDGSIDRCDLDGGEDKKNKHFARAVCTHQHTSTKKKNKNK